MAATATATAAGARVLGGFESLEPFLPPPLDALAGLGAFELGNSMRLCRVRVRERGGCLLSVLSRFAHGVDTRSWRLATI